MLPTKLLTAASGKMTKIVQVGTATGVTSATLPAHQSGDLIIGVAVNLETSGAPTLPSKPTGWTDYLTRSGLSLAAARVSYKIATSSSETSGTWTDADAVAFNVVRGQNTTDWSGRNGSAAYSDVVDFFNYKLQSGLEVNDGTSVVVAFSFANSGAPVMNAPPALTRLENIVRFSPTTMQTAIFSSLNGVSNWGDPGYNVDAEATGWIGWNVSIEIKSS